MDRPPTADELDRLVHALLQPTAAIELAVLVACLLGGWALVRGLRGPQAERGSIWFGHRIVDGALFPLLTLLLALTARWALAGQVPIAVFKLVVPILVSLAVIRLTVRVLRAAFPGSQLMRVVERSVSWIAWLAMVLWITGVLPLMLAELDDIHWKIGASKVSVRNLLEGAVTAVLVLVLALWVSSMFEARLLKGATDNLSIRKMAANALRAVLLFVGVLFAASAAGIDLTALGVLGGGLGVGIGLGLQKLAANYISGFVILAERSMRIGDMVKVDGFEGRITDISTRYTVIRALNGRESIVPNEMLITQRVENASLADPKVLLTTVVQVAYGSPLPTLMPQLAAAAGRVARVVADPAPSVQLSNFAADGLELTIAFWIADPENGQGNVRSAVNLALLEALNEAGVDIPFPQRVVRQA
ncbi:Mechanosensitive ion channel protein [Rubrivivax sp. A210]|uniref:mechanosensitive ion channel family protein n=1 Tax=Rubrivivax sp. A210 TaxID=2772301 RepID=UPI00191AC046|nr:mechanosensitive ion channel domain-containing protein [Rubrivivax sp. A210]CAD5374609.1 Mechanosensitive ion channel protein [Rubrivivax sp. A210]